MVEGGANARGVGLRTCVASRLRRRRDGRPVLWFELLATAWLFWLYDVVNDLAPTRRALALHDAAGMISFERSLHLAIELSVNHWLAAHAALAFIATCDYFYAHVVVTLTVLVLLWLRRPGAYRSMRTRLVIINVIAFVIFWRYPLAPPRMLPRLGFDDIVATTHAGISWQSGALVHDANQFAAMPSLHIAWAMWSALGVWKLSRSRILRTLATLYPLLTAVIVIATGNHYVMDVLAGAATMCCGLVLQQVLERVRQRARGWGRAVGADLARAPWSRAWAPIAGVRLVARSVWRSRRAERSYENPA